MFDKIVPFAAIVVFAAIAIFIFLGVLPRVDRALEIRAIEVCGNISRFISENSAESFTAQYPVAEVYEQCLNEAAE